MGNENPLVLYLTKSNFQADSEIEPKLDHVIGQWGPDDGSEKETESVIDVQGHVISLTKNVTRFQVLNSSALAGYSDPDYIDMNIYTVTEFLYEYRSQNGQKQRRVKGLNVTNDVIGKGYIPFENNDVRSIRVID